MLRERSRGSGERCVTLWWIMHLSQFERAVCNPPAVA
jgi:hypothetical protein